MGFAFGAGKMRFHALGLELKSWKMFKFCYFSKIKYVEVVKLDNLVTCLKNFEC